MRKTYKKEHAETLANEIVNERDSLCDLIVSVASGGLTNEEIGKALTGILDGTVDSILETALNEKASA